MSRCNCRDGASVIMNECDFHTAPLRRGYQGDERPQESLRSGGNTGGQAKHPPVDLRFQQLAAPPGPALDMPDAPHRHCIYYLMTEVPGRLEQIDIRGKVGKP